MTAGVDAGISGVVVNAVVRALAELRGSAAASVELDDDSCVPAAYADGLLDQAAVQLAEPGIGIAVARRIPPGALGLLDYALFTGDTWGDAIRRVARYYAVATERVTMEIEEEGDEARIVLLRRYPGNRHWVELSFAVIIARARQAVGDTFRVAAVDFVHPKVSTVATHEQYFAAPVRFDRPANRIVFERGLLGARLRTGATALADALEHRLAELVPPTSDPRIVRVRAAIATSLDQGELSLASVAARIGTSERSLQRALSEVGLGFKELLDEMRRDRALTLLRAGDLSVTDVATKIGYADPTALFRAFRRWTGTTPGAVRSRRKD